MSFLCFSSPVVIKMYSEGLAHGAPVCRVRSYSEFVLRAISWVNRDEARTPEEESVLRTVNAAFNFGRRLAVVDSDIGVVYLIEPPFEVIEGQQDE